jgi:hypothetical protein
VSNKLSSWDRKKLSSLIMRRMPSKVLHRGELRPSQSISGCWARSWHSNVEPALGSPVTPINFEIIGKTFCPKLSCIMKSGRIYLLPFLALSWFGTFLPEELAIPPPGPVIRRKYPFCLARRCCKTAAGGQLVFKKKCCFGK